MMTPGDGNCLMHAASICLYGHNDKTLKLRNAVYELLTESPLLEPLQRRWMLQLHESNRVPFEVIYSKDQWDHEWDEVVRLASTKQRESGGYEHLEQVHVMALAYVLRRPVIIIADTHPDARMQLGGIYLPLDVPQEDCNREPIFIAYHGNHFSALIAIKPTTNTSIPLVDFDRQLLPLHFGTLVGPEVKFESFEETWLIDESEEIALLQQFMNVHPDSSNNGFLCARVFHHQPAKDVMQNQPAAGPQTRSKKNLKRKVKVCVCFATNCNLIFCCFFKNADGEGAPGKKYPLLEPNDPNAYDKLFNHFWTVVETHSYDVPGTRYGMQVS